MSIRRIKGKLNNTKDIDFLTPPPNMTGEFHCGHFVNAHLYYFIMKVLESYTSNLNLRVVGGVDHAGSSAENQVNPDRRLSSKECFERLIRLYQSRNNRFQEQLIEGRIDFSNYDYHFSLDDNFHNIVNLSFHLLRSLGYIREDHYFLNIDSKGNVLSDLEVSTRKLDKRCYRYVFKMVGNDEKYLEVGTTMPGTMLSDVALAVHPEDDRYIKGIGEQFLSPVTKERLTLFSSSLINPRLYSGVAKLTPLYDKKDFKICMENGIRLGKHSFDREGRCTFQDYKDLSYEEVDDILSKLSADYVEIRSKALVTKNDESRVMHYLSKEGILDLKQIYLDNRELILDNLNVKPLGCRNECLNGLEKLDIGCISRDINWGFKIPIDGDERTLETGFNASLGFLFGRDDEFAFDYLINGWDLIFFGYLRMTLISIALTGRIPFKYVYFHNLVTDNQGMKMSKSIGNVLNPKDLIDEYGIDALRLSILKYTNGTKYMRLLPDAAVRRLINKFYSINNYFVRQINESNNIGDNLNPNNDLINLILLDYIRTCRDLYSHILRFEWTLTYETIEDFIDQLSRQYIPRLGINPNRINLIYYQNVFAGFVRRVGFILPIIYDDLKPRFYPTKRKIKWDPNGLKKYIFLEIINKLFKKCYHLIKDDNMDSIPEDVSEILLIREDKNLLYLTCDEDN